MIFTLHEKSPEVDGVPGSDLQSHLTTAGGVYNAIPSVQDVVVCLRMTVPINVEEYIVLFPGLHPGIHTEGYPPHSRHGHGEDSCNNVANISISG